MKNKIQICTFLLVALLVSAIPVYAQTAGISTTLSAAITDTRSQTVVVASATSITAGSTVLMVDREVMFVNAVNGTTLRVMRGYGGSRAYTHASGATVYVGPASGVGTFIAFAKFGTCTATNEAYLPQVVANINASTHGALVDCFGSNWQINDNLPRYALTVSPSAARSATSPSAGANSAITAQGGGAQSATTSNGAAGGTLSLTAGAGGAGGASSGTGGAGGAASLTGGAGGGTVTGGAGGAVTVSGGAGANGSGAGGTGGALNLYSGAAGTGGTGVSGAITIKSGGASGTTVFSAPAAGGTTVSALGTNKPVVLTPTGSGTVQVTGGTDPTKIAAFDASGITTATTRTLTIPDADITISGAKGVECGTSAGACSATAIGSTLKIVRGTATSTSASPSTVSITGISPAFTSANTYSCFASNATTVSNVFSVLTAGYVSGSAVTFTGPNTLTDVIRWTCIGY